MVGISTVFLRTHESLKVPDLLERIHDACFFPMAIAHGRYVNVCQNCEFTSVDRATTALFNRIICGLLAYTVLLPLAVVGVLAAHYSETYTRMRVSYEWYQSPLKDFTLGRAASYFPMETVISFVIRSPNTHMPRFLETLFSTDSGQSHWKTRIATDRALVKCVADYVSANTPNYRTVSSIVYILETHTFRSDSLANFFMQTVIKNNNEASFAASFLESCTTADEYQMAVYFLHRFSISLPKNAAVVSERYLDKFVNLLRNYDELKRIFKESKDLARAAWNRCYDSDKSLLMFNLAKDIEHRREMLEPDYSDFFSFVSDTSHKTPDEILRFYCNPKKKAFINGDKDLKHIAQNALVTHCQNFMMTNTKWSFAGVKVEDIRYFASLLPLTQYGWNSLPLLDHVLEEEALWNGFLRGRLESLSDIELTTFYQNFNLPRRYIPLGSGLDLLYPKKVDGELLANALVCLDRNNCLGEDIIASLTQAWYNLLPQDYKNSLPPKVKVKFDTATPPTQPRIHLATTHINQLRETLQKIGVGVGWNWADANEIRTRCLDWLKANHPDKVPPPTNASEEEKNNHAQMTRARFQHFFAAFGVYKATIKPNKAGG